MRSKRKNKTENQKLRDKAWKVFGDWIKERDNYTCVTCGQPGNQAGHFFHNVLDFSEENINCQCVRCNHWLSGNLALYSIYLLNKLGAKKFKELDKKHYRDMKAQKRPDSYYLKIIKKYDKYGKNKTEQIKY
jgi:hypothetical protein